MADAAARPACSGGSGSADLRPRPGFPAHRNLTREGVQMRKRILSLLLAVVMLLSLSVVALGADSKTVELIIEPRKTTSNETDAQDQDEVKFEVYLNPVGLTEIGAFQFSITCDGGTITKTDPDKTLPFDEEKGTGIFARFGGDVTKSKTQYTFVAAGTVSENLATTTNPERVWKNPTKTLIVTLTVRLDEGKDACTLGVITEGDKQFSVGYDNGDGTVTAGTGITYKTTIRSSSVKLGDIDGNGEVAAKDRAILARYLAGWSEYANKIVKGEASWSAADINKDGEVTAKDRAILARYLAGWPEYASYFE